MLVYIITNTANGKLYVGQTVDTLRSRFIEHRWSGQSEIKSYTHKTAIAKAIRKYGIGNFNIRILEVCETVEQLNQREAFWINYYNTLVPFGYNLCGGGKNSKRAPIVGQKISAANKGRIKTFTWRANLSKSRKGWKMSDEQKQKISENQKGKKRSEESIKKCRISMLGKNRRPCNEEKKRKISEGLKRYFANKKAALND